MELKLLHLYHNIMNLYGDWANIALLRRHLEALGNTVTVEQVSIGGGADIAGADFVFIGAGTERSQKAVLADFRQYGEAIRAAAHSGKTMLFTGNAFEMLGQEIVDAEGNHYPGIGLADFVTTEGRKRIVEDVFGLCAYADTTIVGFMNKCSRTAGVDTPFLSCCALGFGNETAHDAEGFQMENTVGTHLAGPVLTKNPDLTCKFLSAIYAGHGLDVPGDMPVTDSEKQGYEITLTELRKRLGK